MKHLLPFILFFTTFFFIQPAPAQIFTVEGPEGICAGTSATLTASGCTGMVQWSTGSTTTSITVDPTVSTLYSVTCTESGGDQQTKSHAVGVFPKPTLTPSIPNLCTSENVTLRTNTTEYTHSDMAWKLDGQPVVSGSGAYVADRAGMYTVEDTVTPGAWAPYPSSPAGGVYRTFSFTDENSGWAIRSRQDLVKTEDGGKSWFKPTYALNLADGDSLVDLEFVDVATGWLCAGGKIFKTGDGGATWSRQYADSSVILNDLFFLDSQRGWAVGRFNVYGSGYYYESTVLSTSDGGATWQRTNPPSRHAIIGNVQFISATVGWGISNLYDYATGAVYDGTVYKTTDGGATWNPQITNPSSGPLSYVYFKDANNGWLTGSYLLANTKDGGNTWSYSHQINAAPFSQNLGFPYAISFTGAVGWILDQNRAYYTSNGGQSWITSDYKSNPYYTATAAFLPSGEILVASSTGNSMKFIPKTQSCLSSVAILPAPQPPVVTSNSALATALCDGQSITLTGSQCAGTLSWSTGSKAASITVTIASNSPSYTAYCTGSNGCRSTTDINPGVVPKPTLTTSSPVPCNRPVLTASIGSQQQSGMNFRWKRSGVLIEDQYSAQYKAQRSGTYTAEVDLAGVWAGQSPANFNVYGLRNVQFVTDEIGFSSGVTYTSEPIFLSTSDGGKHWYLQYLPIARNINLHELYFVNATHGWMIGELYSGPTSTTMLRTTDGGKSWKITKIPSNRFSTLFFIDTSNGWIAGDSGKIWKTTDGGVSWVSQHPFQDQMFVQTIFFWDSMRGWAGTSKGTLLSTQDGGATWTPLPESGIADFRSLQFTSATEGWATSDAKNGLYRTVDGGTIWQQVGFDASGNSSAYQVQFVNDSTGFVMSARYIHGTTDRGATWKHWAECFNVNAMSFTDATHGWTVGFSINSFRPVLPGCASSSVEIQASAIAPLTTLISGSWDTPDVWSCGTIPTALDAVRINSGHTITLPDEYSAKAKSIEVQGEVQSGLNADLQLGQN